MRKYGCIKCGEEIMEVGFLPTTELMSSDDSLEILVCYNDKCSREGLLTSICKSIEKK